MVDMAIGRRRAATASFTAFDGVFQVATLGNNIFNKKTAGCG
jgi:hypothetical protein